MSTISGKHIPDVSVGIFYFDKFIHSFMYAVLTLLMINGQFKQHRFSCKRFQAIKNCALLAIVYGIVLEFLQPIISNRTLEVLDGIANILGVLAGIGIFYFIYGIKFLHQKD